eukprot:scaffold3127_cov52-Attheya_sp.AAC.1
METSTTVIRVKRRRSESHEPPACLRIPTIDNTSNNIYSASAHVSKTNRQGQASAFPGEDLLSHLMHTSTYIAQRSQPPTVSTAASTSTSNTAAATASPRQKKKRRSGDDEDDSPRKSVAVFRRMGTYADANANDATSSASSRNNKSNNNNNNNKSKRKNDWIRVVNAELDTADLNQKDKDHHEHGQEQGQEHGHGQPHHPPRKRVKLALRFMDTKTMSGSEFWSSPGVSTWQSTISNTNTNTNHTTAPTKKKRGAPVLDPVSRIVDSSLRTLHLTSGPSVQPHLHLLQTDSCLLTFSHQQQQQQQGGGWINFCCTNGAGTILHAAALWNDLEGSHVALNTMGADVTVLDGDGRTAYDVAIMAGSSGVAEQIVRAGGGPTDIATDIATATNYVPPIDKQNRRKTNNTLDGMDMMNDQEAEGRDEDFVYDVYCLASTDHDAEETDKEARGDEEEKKIDMPAGTASPQSESPAQIIRSNTENGDNEATASSSQHDEEIRAEPPSPSRVTKSAATAANTNASDNNDGEESSEDSSAFDAPQTVELKNGIGYWTENGELILETQMDDIAGDADMYDDLPDVEEDHDSNDEDYEGNDYPDDFDDYGDEIDEYYYDRGGMTTATNYNANRTSTRGYSDSSDDEEGGGNTARGEYRNHSLPESMKQAALRPDEIVSAGLNHRGYRHDDKDDDDDEDFGDGEYRGNFLVVQESDESVHASMQYAYDAELDGA